MYHIHRYFCLIHQPALLSLALFCVYIICARFQAGWCLFYLFVRTTCDLFNYFIIFSVRCERLQVCCYNKRLHIMQRRPKRGQASQWSIVIAFLSTLFASYRLGFHGDWLRFVRFSVAAFSCGIFSPHLPFVAQIVLFNLKWKTLFVLSQNPALFLTLSLYYV